MAFEHASPAVLATVNLRPGQCRACLDSTPWRCQEAAEGDGPWCPAHRAAYTRPPEPPKRRRTLWRARR